MLHQEVSFPNQLHISILDAIVNHLHKMARSLRADPLTAGVPLNLSGDGLQHGLDLIPSLPGSAWHNTWPVKSTFLSA